MHIIRRCGLLLQMWQGLCMCLLVTVMSCAKAAEPSEMPFGVWMHYVTGSYFH